MTTINRDATIEISASAEKLWNILADDFTEVSKWVDSVISSGPNPAAPNGLNGSRHGGRVCEVQGIGKTEEILTAYDAENRSLSYSVEAANFPGFLEKIENTWRVQRIDENNSNVTISLEISVSGDGEPGSPEVGFAEQIASTVDTAGQQLKSFAEA